MKLLILPLLLFNSCSNYVNNLHNQIDNEQRAKRAYRARLIRQRQMQLQRNRFSNRNNPVTLSGNNSNLAADQRNYRPINRRKTVEDLKDNDSGPSLWSGQSSENFLFVTNNFKKVGDIVIVEVLADLKDKIQDELKRKFPEPKKKAKKSSSKDKKDAEVKEEPATETVSSDDKDKVYDKISTSVIERINQDYLLIRGSKEVLFKDIKRYVEIRTVVSQKDINPEDTVSSLKLLEPKIKVLR